MNENEFSSNIAGRLTRKLESIEPARIAQLKAAREKAMLAYREPVSIFGMATAMGPSSWLKANLMQKPLILLSLFALMAVLASTSYLRDPDSDIGDLDAALLTGELPINAFLDKDFDTWLKGSD